MFAFDVMKPVVSVVKFFHSYELSHAHFGILRSEAEAEYPYLPYHTTVEGLAMTMFHCDVLSSRLRLKFLLNEKNHLQPLFLNMNGFGN